MTDVTLRQMRYYVALAEERHFGRAAQRLHITQPPLSRQIAELEATLGLTLLVRDPRQLRLSPAGERALAEFRSALAAVEAALARVSAESATPPVLRLGLLNWLDSSRLQTLQQQLGERGLAAGVATELLASHEAVAAVRAGRLDAALVAAPIEAPGLDVVTLGQLRMMALVPDRSPLARRRTLALADLNGEPPFYRFRRAVSPVLWDHFDRQYRRHGFTPLDEAAAPEAIDVMARIGAGRGCTLMPEPLAVRRYVGVTRRPLKEPVTLDIALALSPAMPSPLRSALVTAVTAAVTPAGG
ncbi:MAG: LysR family transcriptional regulator [Rhizobacter sp.]|nr:LysR family transcriptional regulator [Rhizobacter sp.]